MNVAITITDQVSERLRALGLGMTLAMARAVNRTMQSVRTETVRRLADDVGLPQREIRKSLELRKATRNDLRAELTVSGRRIPLIAFHARQTRAGVSYGLRGGRGVAPSAFIATMRSGHRGVFRRRSRARLPIDELRGPSLPHVFGARRIREALWAVVDEVYPRNLDHEIAFLAGDRHAPATPTD
jgi:hypothetical protein